MRGPTLVYATLSLFVIVPIIVFFAWQVIDADFKNNENPALDWAQRAEWPALATTYKSLERGVMSQARTGETYKDYEFHPDAELVASIQRCAALAASPVFLEPVTAENLRLETDARADQFYAPALLALWHEQHNQTDEANAAWATAFARAPAALVQPVTDADGRPRPNADVGTVAFTFDRVENDRIDATLQLVYPHARTGDDGVLRLPVFKMLTRITDPALAPPRPNAPDAAPWITYPGRVGRLPTVIDHDAELPKAED